MLTEAEKRRLTPQELLEAEREEQQIADRRREDNDDYNLFSAAIGLLDRNPALALDQGLTRAARNHALAMAQAQQLSHQFAGEPALSRRIAAVTGTGPWRGRRPVAECVCSSR